MKAILQAEFGEADVLKMGETETPEPGHGQVRIKVAATTVNRADCVQRQGNYHQPPGDSTVLGLEVAGTVDALGPGVSGFEVGERVMSLVGGGGYAEYAVAYASHVMRIPERLDIHQAACVCETYITAYLNIFMLAGLKDGETVLVHGGGRRCQYVRDPALQGVDARCHGHHYRVDGEGRASARPGRRSCHRLP